MAKPFREEEDSLNSRLKDFPNFLNLNCPGLTQNHLRAKLHSLQEEDEADDICEEESVFKLNFKSWVYMKLGDDTKAMAVNDEVIERTGWKNIMSIANRACLNWRVGKEKHSSECLEKLEALKRRPDFISYQAVAKAELAYSYSRIGGPTNLFKSMQIFEEVLKASPQNYHWRLRLGLVYRRATHMNIYTGISQALSLHDCLTKAVTNLTDVSQNCTDDRLRGPAFSELAVMCRDAFYMISKQDHRELFGDITPEKLCSLALECDPHNVWALTSCGKILRCMDLNKAITLLEESLQLRKHTTVYHHLGLCYQTKAKQLDKRKKSSLGRDTKKRETSSYQRRGGNRSGKTRTPWAGQSPAASQNLNLLLSINDPKYDIQLPNSYFDKAVEAFEQAIETSSGVNFPAVYSLGLLLKLAHQEEKALERFNQITNFPPTHDGHLVTIISSYEQAGLCYMNMAANLVSTVPELQDWSWDLWQSFTVYEGRLDAEKNSPTGNKKLVRLLELVRDYGKIVEVLQNMLARRDDQLDDAEFIRSGLTSYLELGQYERSLAFLNMASTRPALTRSEVWKSKEMVDLRCKVQLYVCLERLRGQSGDARFVFQELFKLQYGRCAGNTTEDMLDTGKVDIDVISDVLVVYDDSQDSDEGPSTTSVSVSTLQNVLTDVFGLDTSNNLQNCGRSGVQLEVQLDEMKKYQVVILVLDDNKETSVFKTLIKMVPSLEHTDPPNPTVLVLDTRQGVDPVLPVLRHYRSMKLQDIGGLNPTPAGAQAGCDHSARQSIVQDVFHGDVEAVLKLFCFLVGREWPCL